MNFSETGIIKPLQENSGTGMMIGLFLTLVICLIIDIFHLSEMYNLNIPKIGFVIGILQAILIQGLRLISALAGISEFTNGRKAAGTFGLLLSFGLTVFVCVGYIDLAETWTVANPSMQTSISMGLQLPVWTGLILEVRIILNAVADAKKLKAA